MDKERESRRAKASSDLHLPQDKREVRRALSRLGLSELRREPQEGEQLDRQTKDYIRTLRDKENEPERLARLKDVVHAAHCQAGITRQYLQQSRPALDCTVHTLHTFLQAPAGWFLALCGQQDVMLALRPTFPKGHSCNELRQAATHTLYLQLCVNEHHVPPQLIVREVRQQDWGHEGSGQDVGDPCLEQPLPEMFQSQGSRRMLNTEKSLCVLTSRSGNTDRQDQLNEACMTESHRLSEPFNYSSREPKSRHVQLKEATSASQTNKNDTKQSPKEICGIQLTVPKTKTSSGSSPRQCTQADRKVIGVETSQHRSVSKLAWSSGSQHEYSIPRNNASSPMLSLATATSSTPCSQSIHVDAVKFPPDEGNKDLSHNAQKTSNYDMCKSRSTVIQNSNVGGSKGEVVNNTSSHSTRLCQCPSAHKPTPKAQGKGPSDKTQMDEEVRTRGWGKCQSDEIQPCPDKIQKCPDEIQPCQGERSKHLLKGLGDNSQDAGEVRPRDWRKSHAKEIQVCGEVRTKHQVKGFNEETCANEEVKPPDQLKGHNKETQAYRQVRPKDRSNQLKGCNDDKQGCREVRPKDQKKTHSEETQTEMDMKATGQQRNPSEKTRVDEEERLRDTLKACSEEKQAGDKVKCKDQLKDEKSHVTGKARSAQALLKDVTVVRESREALVPERSGSRVFVRGHYVQKDTQKVLPFMLFVHMERSSTATRQPGPITLSGSYVRKMLTTKKNLRWRFRHVISL